MVWPKCISDSWSYRISIESVIAFILGKLSKGTIGVAVGAVVCGWKLAVETEFGAGSHEEAASYLMVSLVCFFNAREPDGMKRRRHLFVWSPVAQVGVGAVVGPIAHAVHQLVAV